MLNKSKLFLAAIICFSFAYNVQAAKPKKRYSVAFAPYFEDEYDDMGAFAQSEFGDKGDKYQFQFNILRNSDFLGFLDEAESSEDYYSFRSMKFRTAWSDPNAGATEYEGYAFIYGRRYYLMSENRDGLGYGWYVGAFFGDQYEIDLTDDLSGPRYGNLANSSDQGSVFQPLASLEVFYKWYAYKGLYIEPGVLIGADTGGDSIEPALFTQLIVGYEF